MKIPSRRLAILTLVVAAAACDRPAPAPITPAPPPPPPAVSVTTSAPAPPEPASLVLRGRIFGHDRAPMKLAHVQVEDKIVAAKGDGSFEIQASRKGFFSVRFTGVLHAPHTVGVYFDGHDVSLDVSLGTYDRIEPISRDAHVVARARAKGGARPRLVAQAPLLKQPRGLYAALIPPKEREMLIGLEDVVPDREVEAPGLDRYEHIGDGAYLGVVRARGKQKVSIRLDPSKLPRAGLPAVVTFSDPASRAARVAALWGAAERRADEGPKGRAAHAAARAEIARTIPGERDPEVATAMRMAYLLPESTLDRKSQEAVSIARWLTGSLPPSARLWAFSPEAAIVAASLVGPSADARLDAVGDGLAPRDVAADFLASRVRASSLAGRDGELSRLWGLLSTRFPGTPAKERVRLYEPSRKVRSGREIPAFDLPLLEGGRVTRASLRGKVVLIDFWATWCVPCRKEMRNLHDAFARHSPRGFTIVSVASKDRTASIKNFRRLLWPMPWSQVVLDAGNQEETVDLFEIKSYPSPILVDAKGKIVALGEELRGDGLRRALDVAMDGR